MRLRPAGEPDHHLALRRRGQTGEVEEERRTLPVAHPGRPQRPAAGQHVGQRADALSAFDQDDFVKVKGVIHKYNGRWQITIHKMRKLGESEIDYSDYLPKTSKDIEQLWRTLCDYVASFENPWLKALLQRVHVRRGDRGRLQECARGQDAAPRLRRRPARPRGVAVHGVRSGVAQLSAGQSRSAAERRLPARHRQAARAHLSALHRLHHRRASCWDT